MSAYHSVVLCFEAMLLVEGVEVTPMSPAMLALALLELASAVDHLGEELLAGAYVKVEDDNFAMRHAAGKHADFVVAHRDLQITIGAVHDFLCLPIEDGIGREVVGFGVGHTTHGMAPSIPRSPLLREHIAYATLHHVGMSLREFVFQVVMRTVPKFVSIGIDHPVCVVAGFSKHDHAVDPLLLAIVGGGLADDFDHPPSAAVVLDDLGGAVGRVVVGYDKCVYALSVMILNIFSQEFFFIFDKEGHYEPRMGGATQCAR